MLILYDNLFSRTTDAGYILLASSFAAGYPQANIADWQDYDFWKPGVAGVSYVEVNFTAAHTADTVAIYAHDIFTNGGYIKLEYFNGAAFVQIALLFPTFNGLKILKFNSTAATKWRITLSATPVTSKVGIVFLGVALVMPAAEIGIAPPLVPEADTTTNRAMGGALLGVYGNPKASELKLSWEFQTPAFVRASWNPFMQHAARRAFILAWDENNLNEAWWCWCEKPLPNPSYTHATFQKIELICQATDGLADAVIPLSAVDATFAGAEFYAPLSDAGSGAVNLTLARGTGSATFTRAGATATTIGATGLVIKGIGANVARSYYDPTTLQYMGYLAEGASTNLLLQSEVFDNVAWSRDVGITVTANQATAPDSTFTMDKMTRGAGTLLTWAQLMQAVSASPFGKVYSFSVWVASVSGTQNFALKISDHNFVTKSSTAQIATTTPKLFKFEGQIGWNVAATLIGAGIDITTATGDLLVWGAQLEESTFASSYIPTTTVAVTRNSDVDSYATASNIVAAQGSIYLEYTPQHTPIGTIFLWGTYVDASNYTAILHNATNLIFRKQIAGVNTDATIANAFVSGTTYKLAVSWGTAGMSIVLNGTVGTPHANTASAQISATMQIGADGNGAQQPYAALKAVRKWQTQLPNATLQALTAP